MIGQLQRMERSDLMRRYGTMGDRLYHLSRGQDEREVQPDQDAKSVSAETTFDIDLASQRRPRAGAARAFGKGLGAAEEGRHRRPHRRAQAEDPGFQDPHAQPPARRSDPAGRPHLPDRAASARARDRRHLLPPARHRRQRPHATTTRPTRPTLSTSSRASARWPKAPSTRCARSSAARRSRPATRSARAAAPTRPNRSTIEGAISLAQSNGRHRMLRAAALRLPDSAHGS